MVSTESNGGSQITSYNLAWDSGSGSQTFINLVGFEQPYLLTSFMISQGIVSGITYRFKLRAKNVYGYGPWSEYLDLVALSKPEIYNFPPVFVSSID